MKRFLVLMMVLMAVVWSAPSEAAFQDMQAYVYRWTGGYNGDGSPTVTRATTGITYRVQASAADTKETLYAYNDNTFTSKTNPVTATVFGTDGGVIQFRVDPTDSTDDRYVDLVVVDTVGGYSTVYRNFDKYTRSVIIDERPNVVHQGIIFMDMATTASVEKVALSKHTFVSAGIGEVLAANARGAYSVGVSGASSALGYGVMTVVGYRSHGANLGNTVLYSVGSTLSAQYFTTATTSVYTTLNSAEGAAYYGNFYYWFTVMR